MTQTLIAPSATPTPDGAPNGTPSSAPNGAANGNTPVRRVVIDPITRLEGHGRIDVILDPQGEVDRAYFQIPELRGFELFCRGRPAEDMPQLTSRICGVCPTAHHMAATRALDDLYRVTPPPAARKVRELVYNAFIMEDHALHVYFLGGPDFIVGPDAPAALRNVAGVTQTLGTEAARRVIAMRRRLRGVIASVGGKTIHPVFGLPGGVSKGIAPAELPALQELARDALAFALDTLQVFRDIVLRNDAYLTLMTSEAYTHRTYYMGLVDEANRPDPLGEIVRVVGPDGKEFARFPAQRYLDYVAEHVEPWTYVKFCYLRPLGWRGFADGADSGVYAVGPLARLNVAEGMATPQAAAAYRELYDTLGAPPVHYTLATHWARIVEMVQAAERLVELVQDPDLTSSDLRVLPTETPATGIGAVEAPRGTLFHHYETDEQGLIRAANLIVATQNNAARISLSVDKAARALIHQGQVSEGLLNRVEMAFRAYDPCNGCATHTLPGEMPLIARIHDATGEVVQEVRR